MTHQDLYLRFLVALAIGLAVGIERGWKQREQPSGKREAGIRTFAILALIGFGTGIGLEKVGPIFAAAIAAGVVAIVAIAYATELSGKDSDRGATTEVAAVLTFVLGALSGVGELLAAGVTAVVLVALLDYKDELHGFLKRIDRLELTAAVKLLLVSVVLLPVLPDEGFGPGGVFNPHELWWAVVVIAALGFAGYAAIRAAGAQRGALFMGLMGGLLSSTGVTLTASRASKTAEEASLPLAGTIATAQAVMFVRTGVLVSVMNAALLDHIIIALAAGAVAAIAGALFLTGLARAQAHAGELPAGSPDTLGSAMQFVAVVAVVLVVAHYAQALAGDAGVIVSGFLSGAVDVDAATVSASRLAGTQLHAVSASAAAMSIGVALVANSFVKAGIAYVLGSRALAWPAIAVLAASAGAVVLGLAVTVWLRFPA